MFFGTFSMKLIKLTDSNTVFVIGALKFTKTVTECQDKLDIQNKKT